MLNSLTGNVLTTCSSDVNKNNFLRPRPKSQDQDRCLQDQDQD